MGRRPPADKFPLAGLPLAGQALNHPFHGQPVSARVTRIVQVLQHHVQVPQRTQTPA